MTTSTATTTTVLLENFTIFIFMNEMTALSLAVLPLSPEPLGFSQIYARLLAIFIFIYISYSRLCLLLRAEKPLLSA